MSERLKVEGSRLAGKAPLGKPVTFSANIADNGIADDGRFYADMPRQSKFLVAGHARFAAREFDVFKGQFNLENRVIDGVYVSSVVI